MNRYIIISIALIMTMLLGACKQQEDVPGGSMITQAASLYKMDQGGEESANPNSPIIFDVNDDSFEPISQSVFVKIARPAKGKLTATLDFNKEIANVYIQKNKIEGAKILPDANVEIPSNIIIGENATESKVCDLKFIINKDLKINVPYVFALQLSSFKDQNNKEINIYPSGNTMIYVIKRVAKSDDINKVVAIDRAHFFQVEKSLPSRTPNGATIEFLINVNKFRGPGDEGEAGISTAMGIEGSSLLRFGDSGVLPNRLQVCGTEMSAVTFETQKWYHIAVTSERKTITVYVNGEKQLQFPDSRGIVFDNGGDDWYIGKSYSNNRGISADFSEVRLWRVARTQDQIRESMYNIDPNSDGLIAYWKMNSASNNMVLDLTGHGYNLLYKHQSTYRDAKVEIKTLSDFVVIEN